jgi:phosphoglycolate phosphatase
VATAVLLFDLDGTLTDPRAGIVASIRYALEKLDRPIPPDDVLASFIGPPLRGSFAGLLGTADPAQVEEAIRLYRERYVPVGLLENQVYDGIPELLEAAGRRARLLVATSKPAIYAEQIIRHFELDRYFARVYGAELGGHLENKADLLAHLLAAEGIPAGGALMIGDRAADVVAARANGLRSIGVLWGYGSERELRDAGADAICATPAELGALLEDGVISS